MTPPDVRQKRPPWRIGEVKWRNKNRRGDPLCLYCRKPWNRVGVGPIMWEVPKVYDRRGKRTVDFRWFYMAHPECIAKEFSKSP